VFISRVKGQEFP